MINSAAKTARIPRQRPSSESSQPRSGRRRRWPWISFSIAALLISSVVAYRQAPRPDPATAPARFAAAWWQYPVENNAIKRLPTLNCDDAYACQLNGIFASSEKEIWAVGNVGLLLHSVDGGESWSRVALPALTGPSASIAGGNRQRQPAPAPLASPQTTPPPASRQPQTEKKALRKASQFGFSLIPAVYAAEKPSSAPEKSSKPSCSVSLGSSSNPAPAAQPVTFTAHLACSRSEVPSGTVAFKDGAQTLQEEKVIKGQASFTARGLLSGGHTVTAVYSGDSYYSTSTSAAVVQVVEAAENANSSQTQQQIPMGGEDAGPTAQNNRRQELQRPPAKPQTASTKLSIAVNPPVPPEDLLAVEFLNQNVGWIAGARGTIYATQDEGRTWTQHIVYFGEQRPPEGAVAFVRFEGGGHAAWTSPLLKQMLWETPAAHAESSGPLQAKPMTWLSPLPGTNDKEKEARIAWLSNNTSWMQGLFLQFPKGSAALGGTNYGSYGWVTGTKGTIIRFREQKKLPIVPEVQQSGTIADLRHLMLREVSGAPPQDGWAVGSDGIILSTTDGGQHWRHRTQGPEGKGAPGPYRRWPAPWYYVTVLLALAVAAPAMRREPPAAPEHTIADRLTSDRPLQPGDYDPLNFHQVAFGLSRFVRNLRTVPPVTIGIIGDWGMGKSSLMNLLCADLKEAGSRPVWFNAWHHQQEEQLLAALLQNIRLQALPPWWHPDNWIFRARLLTARSRNALPALLLLLLLSVSFGGYEFIHHDHTWRQPLVWVGQMWEKWQKDAAKPRQAPAKEAGEKPVPATAANEPAAKPTSTAVTTTGRNGIEVAREDEQQAESTAFDLLRVIISLFTGFGFVGWLVNKVQAFGVNPAALLAKVSSRARLSDLEKQTSFRQKFSQEFREVCQAWSWGGRRVIIFIDDLDRCRPDNVAQVLEAINFLVTSGDCFIVLGIARETVEHCVGWTFRDVAESEGALKQGLQQMNDLQKAQSRVSYARNYLNKLINIEVNVPTSTAEQREQLLVEEKTEPASLTRWQKFGELLLRTTPQAVARYAPLLLLGLTVNLALFIATMLPQPLPPPIGESAVGSKPAKIVSKSEDRNDTGKGMPTPPQPVPAKPPHTGNTAAVSPASQPVLRPWLSLWPTWLGLALLVGSVAWMLTRRTNRDADDSPEFEHALKIWDAVITAGETPRGIKRFLNRVRYLAMRQRGDVPNQTRWELLKARAGRWFGLPDWRAQERSAIPFVQEGVLVAYETLRLHPPELEEAEIFGLSVQYNGTDTTARRFLASKEQHLKAFGAENWEQLKEYHQFYREYTEGVKTVR